MKTDQEINEVIAEHQGITKVTTKEGKFVAWSTPISPDDDTWSRNPPDYCHDLNMMYALEAGLLGHEMIKYQAILSEICPNNPHVSCWDLLHADARQRAEAFCRTVGIEID